MGAGGGAWFAGTRSRRALQGEEAFRHREGDHLHVFLRPGSMLPCS